VSVDRKGNPFYVVQVASLNGNNLYTARVVGNGKLASIAGGFSANLLNLNFIMSVMGTSNNNDNGAFEDEGPESGSLSLSSDHQTLTGTAKNSFGSVSVKLTREK